MSDSYERSFHRISCGNLSKADKINEPKYLCGTCLKCKDNRCSFFERYVEKDYNRCFNHSHYTPLTAIFRIPDNLDEIIKEEEEKKYA